MNQDRINEYPIPEAMKPGLGNLEELALVPALACQAQG
jgi:hypothetical protein